MPRIVKIEKKEEEGKTLFEHLGLAGKAKGENTSFNKLTKMMKSMVITVIIGYLLGFILDIMMGTNIYALILAISMLIFWLLKVFGKDLRVKK